jgi:hypothetical protein
MLISVFLEKWTIWTYACLVLKYSYVFNYDSVSILHISRARILGKMDYFYFLRHMYETCL